PPRFGVPASELHRRRIGCSRLGELPGGRPDSVRLDRLRRRFPGRVLRRPPGIALPGKAGLRPGSDYFGNSGEPECDEVTAQVPAALDEISILYVLAVFPPGQEPPLRKVSFGIEYDPALLEILEFGADGSIEEQSFTWPAPGTSIHIRFDSVRWQQSTEAVWFAVRQLTETPAFLELQAGSFGGVVGSDHVEWPIEGFGAFGFGQEGQVDCPSLGTCCLAREGCRLLAERWCIKEYGEYL